jgi:XTP/dITP diphosphohydrolase
MSVQVHLVTTNQKKLLTAQSVLKDYSVNLEILPLNYEAPEIQSFDVQEIAAFTAQYIANKENKTVLVTDVGYYINSLKGFPGPYIKQINHYLTSEDLLKLLEGKTDRSFVMRECLGFCIPGNDPVTFLTESFGTISYEALGEGSSIDRIMIRQGMDKVQTQYSLETMIEYYSKHLTHFNQFGEYYNKNYKYNSKLP